MNHTHLSALLAALLLTACATSSDKTNPEKGTFRGGDTPNVETAVLSPVNDVGLDDIEIPDYLALMNDPYATSPQNCTTIKAEVTQLNQLLGEDIDIPEDEAERREQNALNATSSTIGTVLIPFRGVVRAISGAASNERDAREAYQRGLVRRAYLKGIAQQTDCELTQ